MTKPPEPVVTGELKATQADHDALEALDNALGFLTEIERPIVLQAFALHREAEARRCTEIMQRITQAHALPGDVGSILSDHFPSGLRGSYERTAGGLQVKDIGVVTDCHCGWSTRATDEQEARQQWAAHVAAALTPSALSGDAGEGE